MNKSVIVCFFAGIFGIFGNYLVNEKYRFTDKIETAATTFCDDEAKTLLKDDYAKRAALSYKNSSVVLREDIPDGCNIVSRDLVLQKTFFESFDPHKFTKIGTNSSNLKTMAAMSDGGSRAAVMPEDVVDGDPNRTRVLSTNSWPYCATARLSAQFDNVYDKKEKCYVTLICFGTAFLEGEDLGITSAHCVFGDITSIGDDGDDRYDDGVYNPRFADSVELFFGLDGEQMDSNYEYYACADKLYLESHYAIYSSDLTDWAAIKLDRRIGERVGWYGKVKLSKGEQAVGKNLVTIGYPGDAVPPDTMWESRGVGVSNDNDEQRRFKIEYNFPSAGGQSGSPVFWGDPSEGFVCGVLSAGLDSVSGGPFFSDFVYNFLDQFHCSLDEGYTFDPLTFTGGKKYTIINDSPWRRRVAYNSKLCFENDGLSWLPLKDVKYVWVDPYSRVSVSVSNNWFADRFACSYVYHGKRVITCGSKTSIINA